MGTYLGKPDDEDDYDNYVAAKHLLRSGAINIVDTAINYRCQKAERTLGAVFKAVLSEEFGKFVD
jgi:aryl-alcohol dehydrogenase-like predicted oxidoreductase